ncbi:hypothetical protein GN244_ATG18654 [Phytophthora infestans]|uniref:Uncharacterized protein n=1 Tax=Phytophthora infestans TaxID=4787 RepID=A0A833SW71_PHYIN|nr:hypothetical protein GN244_ATG18654 [Phytophthora infestans]
MADERLHSISFDALGAVPVVCFELRCRKDTASVECRRQLQFDVTQRCYSLDSSYGGKASYASWLALKESTRIAFYTESKCQRRA